MAEPVDLTVRRGEIVGLAGLLGSGRTELLKAIFGADRRTGGEVLIEGKPLSGGPAAAVKRGVAFVPEDRLSQGLIGDWEIWRNVSMADLGSLSRRLLRIDLAAERARAAQACAELGVVAPSIDTPCSSGRLRLGEWGLSWCSRNSRSCSAWLTAWWC
jgi:ribose transport system ATP-binding protein